jgi:hypothetical protein
MPWILLMCSPGLNWRYWLDPKGGAAIIFLLACWQASALAQTSAASEAEQGIPRVAVADIDANPGQSLMIPLYFTPDPSIPLHSFTAEIEYVSNNLKFKSAEKGSVIEDIGGTVEASLSEGKADDKGVTRSQLRITVSMPGKQPLQSMPMGLAAYLLFELSTQAKPFAIQLKTSVESAEDTQDPPQKISKVFAKSGLVAVVLADTNPEATCFFFTH